MIWQLYWQYWQKLGNSLFNHLVALILEVKVERIIFCKNRDRMWQWFQAQLQGGRFQHQRTAVRIQSLVKLYAQHVYSVNCRKYRYRKYDDKEREARNGNFSHKNRNHTQRTEISMLRKYISFQLCKGFSYLGLEVSNTNLCSNEDKFEFQP